MLDEQPGSSSVAHFDIKTTVAPNMVIVAYLSNGVWGYMSSKILGES